MSNPQSHYSVVRNRSSNTSGIIRELCEKDEKFGDITMKLSDGNIKVNSNFASVEFKKLKKLIEDEKFENEIIFDMISVKGYCTAEMYKSGYPVQLNDENVVDFLFCGIHLDEKDIVDEGKNYMKNNENEKTVGEFLCNVDFISRHIIYDFDFFGNNYIFKNNSFFDLCINALIFILSKKIIINDENDLFGRLIEFGKKDPTNENMRIIYSFIKKEEIKRRLTDEEQKTLNNCRMTADEYFSTKIENFSEKISKEMRKTVLDYYTNDESIITIREDDVNSLKNIENIKEIIDELLLNKDALINIIGVSMILDMKMEYKVDVKKKSKLYNNILHFYNENEEEIKRESVPRCIFSLVESGILHLCYLIIDFDFNYIYLNCGIEFLFKMANFIDEVSKEKVDLLFSFIGNQDLNKGDYKLMDRIVIRKDIINKFKVKKITIFSYPQKAYTFKPNEDASIKPECDGIDLKYSITPNLPQNLYINKRTGIIKGKSKREVEQKEYEVICENLFGQMKTNIKIEIYDYKFRTDCIGSGMQIQNNDLQAYKTSNGDWNGHAYVNVEMQKGIYRIKYKYVGNNSGNNVFIGATGNKYYNSTCMYGQSNTFSIYAYNGGSNCQYNCGSVVNQPGITNHGDGSEYELIFDMDKREFSVIHDDKETLLMKDIPAVLYPFVEIEYSNCYVELLSVVHE